MECEWNGMGHNGIKWNGCSLSLSLSRRGASSYDTAAREKGSARRRRARRRTPRLGELGALDALPDFLPPHQLDERDRSLRRGGGGRRVPSNESKVPYTPFKRKISTESVDYEYMFSRNAPGAQDPRENSSTRLFRRAHTNARKATVPIMARARPERCAKASSPVEVGVLPARGERLERRRQLMVRVLLVVHVSSCGARHVDPRGGEARRHAAGDG